MTTQAPPTWLPSSAGRSPEWPSAIEAKRQALSHYPANDRELWLLISGVLGYQIPWKPVCAHHQSPFSWLADSFFERERRTLVRGSRDSGKTLMFAILDWLNAQYKPGVEIVHIGSTLGQSQDGFSYLAGSSEQRGTPGFVQRKPLDEAIAGTPSMSRTVWKNGSVVRILTGGSEKSVSGPHPTKALLDEIDHWKPDILNTALLMPRSRDKWKAQVHLASSQYHSFGTMATLMDEAPLKGFKVYEWCLFDVMAAGCPGCGTDGNPNCPLYQWFNPYTGRVEPLCDGRGERADGHLPYEDAIQKFMLVDPETAALQLLLMGGSRNGLVYPFFTDEPYPQGHLRDLPDGRLPGWRFWAGVDLRTHSVIEAIGMSPEGHYYYFDEWSNERSKPSDVRAAARHMQAKWWQERKIWIERFYLDPSQPDEARDWRATEGIPGYPADRNPVLYGIRLIRDGLADISGAKSLFVSPRNERLRLEWSKFYHLKKDPSSGKFDPDTPDKEHDHASDAARYARASGPPPIQGENATSFSHPSM